MQFDVDFDELEEQTVHGARPAIPEVPGRIVQIDADFLAYMVSADENKSLEEMYEKADGMIESIRRAAGAEKVALHLTPTGSKKGNRPDIALLKEYQANRAGKIKPQYLAHIRMWLHKSRNGIMHTDLEADDGMAIAQYAALADGKSHLSIICSKDKDLRMVPGLQMDWDTAEITDTTDDHYGFIKLDRKKKAAKVVGQGQAFFWAQMLMGDAADNISGLPKVCLTQYSKGKPIACGAVKTFEILSKCKTNAEAMKVVRELYNAYGQQIGFKDYRTGDKVSAANAFLSEAKLLWMRREPDENDVLKWMSENV